MPANPMDVASAIERFYEASKLHKEQVHGDFGRRSQPLGLPELPMMQLPPELHYFYSHYHCDALFGSADIAITPFEDLARRQEGFASFSADQGKTMQPDPAWKPQWTVFADVNDNPIVADASAAGAPVYAAIEAVNYKMIAPSLAVFFQMLTAMLHVTASLRAQQPASDDVEDWITFRTGMEIPATLERLGEVADAQYVKALAHFLYS